MLEVSASEVGRACISVSRFQRSLNVLRTLRLQLWKDRDDCPTNIWTSCTFRNELENEEITATDVFDLISIEDKEEEEKDENDIHLAGSDEDNHLAMDDAEGDDDAKTCFPCPFCYIDIEVNMLCIHLQEEHCFDLKNAVCPLCAANLGRDVIGHFKVQHASSLKQRRKSQKSGFWTSSSAGLGKELSRYGRANTHGSAPDPLLSPFICSISLEEPNNLQKDELSSSDVAVTADMRSSVSSSNCDEDIEERRRRAEFVQQLIGSTIF